MKVRLAAAVLGLGFSVVPVMAQTSIDVLEQDLQEARQKHDDANSQAYTTFIASLLAASQSPSQALELYKDAGGNLPDAAPVKSHYEYETPSEKAVRDSQDAITFGSAAIVIQTHCAMMRYAAILSVNPNTPGIQAEWLNWLKTIGPNYPKLGGKRALKDVVMSDSVISAYLGFHGWGDKPPGKWSLSQLPQLYHDLVLEPARHPVTAATLDLWDTYMAMLQADEPDHDQWTQVDEPPLDFDRGEDDFAVQPSMEKLTALDGLIKAHPGSPELYSWIARMQTMIHTYQGGAQPATAPATLLPGATPGTPSSEAAGTVPAATPGTTSSAALGPVPADTPSSPTSGSAAPVPADTPGTPSSAAAGATPAATPGTSTSATGGPIPAQTPGSPSSAAEGAAPVATPATSSSSAAGQTPAATPGTPSSAAPGPIPAPTTGAQ